MYKYLALFGAGDGAVATIIHATGWADAISKAEDLARLQGVKLLQISLAA